jgi:hypothetical protein
MYLTKTPSRSAPAPPASARQEGGEHQPLDPVPHHRRRDENDEGACRPADLVPAPAERRDEKVHRRSPRRARGRARRPTRWRWPSTGAAPRPRRSTRRRSARKAARQFRQNPAMFIRSMFCTSGRSSIRCLRRRRKAAASISMRVWSSMTVLLDQRLALARAASSTGARRSAQACWPPRSAIRSWRSSISALGRPGMRACRSMASPGRWPA